MFQIHQQHQAQIPVIELYVNFKEVVVALYHQVDNEEEELEPDTVPEREVEWEQNISESDDKDFEGQYGSGDDSAYDDANDVKLHISNMVVASQHPFREPTFMRALDLEAMYAPEFPEHMNLGM